MQIKLSTEELQDFMAEVFQQMAGDFEVLDVSLGKATVRLKVADKHLRPGGTVSGPSMFGLADCAFYLVTLAHIGREALTVTTNCSIDFMRKPAQTDMIAYAQIHKLGKTLSVGDVLIYSEGQEEPVARASLTYSIPPKR